jgi:hypothetical protein
MRRRPIDKPQRSTEHTTLAFRLSMFGRCRAPLEKRSNYEVFS